MKVLIIPWNLYPENAGGAGKSIYYTSKSLSKLPEISVVHVLTSTKGKTRTERNGKLLIERYNDLDVKFRAKGESFGFKDIKRKLGHLKVYKNWEKRIREKYEKFKPDMIHCSDPFTLLLTQKALKGKNTPITVSIRGPWPYCCGSMLDKKGNLIKKWTFLDTIKKYKLRSFYEIYNLSKRQRALKKVNGIRHISAYMKHTTDKHLNLKNKNCVIFTPRPLLKDTNNRKCNPRTIAYVGELTYKKGLSKLINALEILVKEGKNYNLIVAGKGGMEKEFKRIVKEKNLVKNVTFLGWVNNPGEVYQSAVLTIFPSLFPEPLGSASEAMNNGSIPIVSNRGGIPESVPSKDLVVDVNNPEKLAKKIKEIIENPAKQKEIRKTFKYWLIKLTPEASAKKLSSFFEEIINENKIKNKKE